MTGFHISTTNRFEMLPTPNQEEPISTEDKVAIPVTEASTFVDRTYTAEQIATEAAIVALISARTTRR